MKRLIVIFTFLSVLITVFGCASKRYTKQAKKLEDSGQFSEAANLYYNAVIADRTNTDAFDGLKRTGQMTLSKKLSEFNTAYNLQNNKEAIVKYQEAKTYYDKLFKLDVSLNFPSFYNDYYNEVKDIFLEDKYYLGVNLIDNESFSEAEKVFNEIIKLQPNYKDSKTMLTTSIYEPKYRDGLKYIEQKRYRQAYYTFSEIVEKENYKSSFDLKNESLKKGTITIAVLPITDHSYNNEIKSSLQNKIINSIQSLNNPFIKILESNTNSDLVLSCEIINFNYDQGVLKDAEKRGYKRKTVQVLNKETQQYENKTEYDKITYTEYSMSRNINMTVTYKLTNNQTKEIYNSDTKSIRVGDDIRYAKYNGDISTIVPGYWEKSSGASSKDKVNDDIPSVRELKSLFTARSKIKDYNTLSLEIINSFSGTISKTINDYILEN